MSRPKPFCAPGQRDALTRGLAPPRGELPGLQQPGAELALVALSCGRSHREAPGLALSWRSHAPHGPRVTRRRRGRWGTELGTLAVLAALLLTAFATRSSHAQSSHGLSAFGDLKYAAGFKQFEYVNPAAPKGGRLATNAPTGATFDSFNAFILKGDAAIGVDAFVFDTLMVRALDEPDAVYGLLARSVELSSDRTSVNFDLRPEARFADGSPVTADDLVFSLRILKEKGHPSYQLLLKDVAAAEAPGPHTVRFKFAGPANRRLPLFIASALPVFSKAWYATRAFDAPSLEPPLGSGPYKVGEFKQGSFVGYRRRDDYWAKDLPVNRGRNNFDEVRFDYFRDEVPELEALKAGSYDFREENTAKNWATAYDIPAVRDGRIQRLTLPDESPQPAQGWYLNTRRAKLADPRVRQALGLAFDFEWTNRNAFFSAYIRSSSYFENSDLKAEGVPSAGELELLEPFRKDLPPEVFGPAVMPPMSDGSGNDRNNLKEADRLLAAAGWTLKGGKRVNARGAVLEVEFLEADSSFDRVYAGFIKNLKAIGVQASVRRVDAAQFQRRVKAYDYDVMTGVPLIDRTPGPELRGIWASGAADSEGSANYAGIKSAAVDALVEKVIEASTRAELVTAARALDRVLRAGHTWIPHWNRPSFRLAFWDKFRRPAVKPKYSSGVLDTWWYDSEKAAKLVKK